MLLDKAGSTPEENERAALSLRRQDIRRLLASPDWAIFRDYLQESARALLDRLLYCKPEDFPEIRASLRAFIEIAREFGVEDLKVDGRLLELDSIIRNQRGQVEEMLAVQRGGL